MELTSHFLRRETLQSLPVTSCQLDSMRGKVWKIMSVIAEFLHWHTPIMNVEMRERLFRFNWDQDSSQLRCTDLFLGLNWTEWIRPSSDILVSTQLDKLSTLGLPDNASWYIIKPFHRLVYNTPPTCTSRSNGRPVRTNARRLHQWLEAPINYTLHRRYTLPYFIVLEATAEAFFKSLLLLW